MKPTEHEQTVTGPYKIGYPDAGIMAGENLHQRLKNPHSIAGAIE